MKTGRFTAALGGLLALGATTTAQAGGYDTPILYSARHIGMGGSAVSYVDDPSAIFHNPAGLQGTKRWSLTANLSPVFGKIRATPNDPALYASAKDKESDYTFAPFFLLGGAYRFTERVTAGFGVYPVASAGAEFSYTNPFAGSNGETVDDRTKLVFIEAAPSVSVQLPWHVTLGASYRMTYVDLERFQGSPSSKFLDFQMTGTNFLGFKGGVQAQPMPQLKLGFTYRHKTVTTIENSRGYALFQNAKDLSTKFTLPSRLVFGARYDFDQLPLGVSSDVEYALNSQNTRATLNGTVAADGKKISVSNVFNWTNAWTVRGGAEYRLLDRQLPLRVGGAWDQQTSNAAYPTAFGTPPGATYIATAGLGWDAGNWQVNAAGAYRTGSGDTTIDNRKHSVCGLCGYTGDKPYTVTMFGLYLDASVNFD